MPTEVSENTCRDFLINSPIHVHLEIPNLMAEEPASNNLPPPVLDPASEKRLVVLDMNGILLKRYRTNPACLLSPAMKRLIHKTNKRVSVVVRPDVEMFLEELCCKVDVIIWSSCTRINIADTMAVAAPSIWKMPRIFFKGVVSLLFSDSAICAYHSLMLVCLLIL